MSARQTGVAWATVFGVCACLLWGVSLSQGQQGAAPAVETLLPAEAVVYVGFDGAESHQQAWEKTAAYEALYQTGLMDVLKKMFNAGVEQAKRQSGGQGPQFEQLRQIYDLVSSKGLSLAISVSPPPQNGPPTVQAVLVLHESARLSDGLRQFAEQAADKVPFQQREVNGRMVTSGSIPNTPGVEAGWWTEGPHLVIVAGMQAVDTMTAVANGDKPNITTSPLWKQYRNGGEDFEVTTVGWLDFRSLRESFGPMPLPVPGNPDEPLTVNRLLQALGLDSLNTVVGRSGYKGRAMWSESVIEAPGPRKGLLALGDQPPMTLADLPPLPFSTAGFYACSVDWPRLYDTLTQTARDVAALGPPDSAAQLEGMLDQLPAMIGFDIRDDLLAALDNVSCVYGDTRQGVFGMGFGIVCEVKDAAKLKSTLDTMLQSAQEQAPNQAKFRVERTEKNGREIVSLAFAGGTFNPSFCVDDHWLAVGLMPQVVDAFMLRVDNKLTNWKPSASYQAAFSELPAEFTSIASSDPRKTYRALLNWAPMLISVMKLGMQQSGMAENIDIPITAADLPPAEQVARPLFPNVTVVTVNEEGFQTTSRTSLPSVPLLGGSQNFATVGVLAALVLPAVQQSREAARRVQSSNNLKQIGLALHNHHDMFRSFPAGTVPNDELKPEERLSWQVEILPFLEQQALWQQIDRKQGWQAEANQQPLRTAIPQFRNPALGKQGGTDTHYVGIAGLGADGPTLPANDKRAGIFAYNRPTRMRDVTDGTSNTMMVGEVSQNLGPWGAGGKSTIRPFVEKPYINGPDGFGGIFRGGANFLFADGSVRFLSENIDPQVLEAMATMAGGEVVQVP